MDFSEKWGTDVDAAVKLALDELKLSIDEVEVTVLEEPSRGFFGIGSKLARVRVEKKKSSVKEEKPQVVEEVTKDEAVKEEKFSSSSISNRATDEVSEKKSETHKLNKEIKLNKAKKEETVEPVIERVPDDLLSPVENHVAIDFLKEVTKEMGLDLEISGKVGEDIIYINIEGKDSGTIIGKRGQTLDAIQYLTSLVVNKGEQGYTRVVIDCENYRAKREKTLEGLANRLANKVSKTKRSVKLEPMNPYERKVIHSTLHNHPRVITRSEGEEPYRRVIIELK